MSRTNDRPSIPKPDITPPPQSPADTDSPTRYLWTEIARRFGQAAHDELYADYLAVCRVYNRQRLRNAGRPAPSDDAPRQRSGRPPRNGG